MSNIKQYTIIMKKKKAHVVIIANQKGGVGKTTTAVNLAASLAAAGKKTLLVDSDPQGNASSSVGMFQKDNQEKGIYDCYSGQATAAECLQATGIKNLIIMPSSIDLVGVEVEMISVPHRERILKDILRDIKERIDFIVIDSPPSLGLLTLNGLTAADSVIIPLQCEYFALEGLALLLDTIRTVRKKMNRGLYIEGILLTMFDKRNKLTYQVAKEISRNFGDLLFKQPIPRNVRLSEAPSHGKPIVEYDKGCPGAVAYRNFTNEFLFRVRS